MEITALQQYRDATIPVVELIAPFEILVVDASTRVAPQIGRVSERE